MALNTNNFLGASNDKQDHSGVTNALGNYLKGYQGAMAPQQMEEAEKRARVEDALKQLELQNKPEDYETQFDLRRAQAEHQRNPSNRLTGLAAEWNSVNELEQRLGANHPVVQGLKRDLKNRANVQESLYGTRQQNMQFKPWASLNKDEQAKISGQYTSLGIGAQDGLELWTHGITPELIHGFKQQNPDADNMEAVKAIVASKGGQGGGGGMAQQGGGQMQQPQEQGQAPQQLQQAIQAADPRSIPIQPAMTSSNRTNYNELQSNRAEAKYLGEWVTEHNAPYSQFPVKEVWDSFANRKDKETQRQRHEYLAAQMMGPDAALLNIRLAGGSSARDAIHDLEKRMKLEAKGMGLHITPEDYRAATRIMHEVLDKGADIRGQALSGQINPNSMQTAIRNSKDSKNTVQRVVKGKTYNIPEHLVKQFDEDHK